jgi:hypothetical protein
MPTVRNIFVNAVDYLSVKLEPEKLKTLAEAFIPEIIEALTSPLTDEEKNVRDLIPDYAPKTFTGADYADAYEAFQQYIADEHLGDGLPVAPDTVIGHSKRNRRGRYDCVQHRLRQYGERRGRSNNPPVYAQGCKGD